MSIINTATRELFIYSEIGSGPGEIDEKQVVDALAKLGPGPVMVRINSYGGSVDAGLTIYTALRGHRGTVTTSIDGGIAASIASVILLAGAVRVATASASVMVHDPWGVAFGTADDFEKMADVLRHYESRVIGIYKERTLMSEADIRQAMKAETFYSAADALEHGFLTKLETFADSEHPALAKAQRAIEERKARASWPQARERVRAIQKREEVRLKKEYVTGKLSGLKSRGRTMNKYPPSQFPLRTRAALAVLQRKIAKRRRAK